MLRRRGSDASAAPVPFDPAAARALRAALGLSPASVARVLAESYALPVPAALVIAWETGATRPQERELIALARVLWCLPGQLMGGGEQSLRDHRLALDLPQEEVARRVRVSPRLYARMEQDWDGDRAQTADLATALRLSPRALVRACGRGERLDELLRRAVDGRWQSQVDPVRALAPTLRSDCIGHALSALAGQRAAASALWGSTSTAPSEPHPPTASAPRHPVAQHLAARHSAPQQPSANRPAAAESELAERFWLLVDEYLRDSGVPDTPGLI